MNIIIKTICTVSIASLYIVPVVAIAKQSSHKIGFVKVSPSELRLTGTCGYRLVGSKEQDNVILATGLTDATGAAKKPLMNIDGENISLKLVSRKKSYRNNKFPNSINKYEPTIFTVVTDFRDATTSKDRKNFATRERGSIVVTSNDGWRKKIEVECAYDSGG
jgi:hypothetical protein